MTSLRAGRLNFRSMTFLIGSVCESDPCAIAPKIVSIFPLEGISLMSSQYQHYVQKRYLDRWRVGNCLYLFDKTTGKFEKKQSARSIMGMQNMQTPAMEEAFEKAEKHVGHTDQQTEITDPVAIRLFADWTALHLVRNGLNAPTLGSSDYSSSVRSIATKLANHHYANFMIFRDDHLITGDNPVIQINDRASQSFIMAALSPQKCVFFSTKDAIPVGFLPPTINWYIYKTATRYCVSFDSSLHIEDPAGMILFYDRE